MQFYIKDSWTKHTTIIVVWKWLFTMKPSQGPFSPLKMLVYYLFILLQRSEKWRSKVTFLTVNFTFLNLFLCCASGSLSISTDITLCDVTRIRQTSWRTIAKTLTVATTRKCFRFSLFCFCSSQTCLLYLTFFCCLFWWWLFQIKHVISCDLKAKPIKETKNAFTSRGFQRIPFNLVSSCFCSFHSFLCLLNQF